MCPSGPLFQWCDFPVWKKKRVKRIVLNVHPPSCKIRNLGKILCIIHKKLRLHYRNPTQLVGLVQSGPHHYFIVN